MGDMPQPSASLDERSNADLQPAIADGKSISTTNVIADSSRLTAAIQPQPSPISQHAFSSQLEMAVPVPGRTGPYHLGSLATALPQANFNHGRFQGGQQRSPHPPFPTLHQTSSYSGHSPVAMAPPDFHQHGQPQLLTQFHAGHQSVSPLQASGAARSNVAYYPHQGMTGHPQSPFYYPQPTPYQNPNQPLSPTYNGPFMSPVTGDRRQSGISVGGANPMSPVRDRNDGYDARQSPVRGPPRKPRHSGHAVWIGNLPPQTDLMKLVHHVCGEADGLHSLFLIVRSNCAFANFGDEATCIIAQQKIHESRFQAVRLVSRLRKFEVDGASGPNVPPGPATSANSTTPLATMTTAASATTNTAASATTTTVEPTHTAIDPSKVTSLTPVVADGALDSAAPSKTERSNETNPRGDRYFILKSLTVEDLDMSCRTGIWATQTHNEAVLDQAFRTADNVFLIFSANKSGEYFGYARMRSVVNQDPGAAIEFAPRIHSRNKVDLPQAITTEARDKVPRGKIIRDRSRETIFWEADRDDAESTPDSNVGGDNPGPEDQTWGKPFKLEWLSTSRLPFHRTRGLRNSWNSNREVKIARDGTELESSVGRRLIGLFGRGQSPPSFPTGMSSPSGFPPSYPGPEPFRR